MLAILVIASVTAFSQGQFLRGYKLSEHNPKEGVYERFFGHSGNDKKPIQEISITQRSDGNVSLWPDFGDKGGFGKPAEEDVNSKTFSDGGKSVIYSYYFPETPITLVIIEIYKAGKKIPECTVCMKSMEDVIYFAKATKVTNKEELKLFSKKK